ncbi:hypothetical protein J2Y45_004020 [Dyadobacter sp. BE34]|uniref:Outer membrane protein beta-barrel domain-containing protein n=1 Tax=Dyadobacter fermentans TaxID=94254 RepID=A0ABU1R0C0_9BACT|nr:MULTISPECIES: hypothetical protein [Dyadobacter]MDR6806828.1 hypothetical protein [Dyadobacter fermentans]MDR7044570.1 hypothetical protein [Dyadobacter sp. BE242]MDR7198880.1 hypothetical protein [Dyadobacter sp. BE34]MDR7216842.1 hypothetical protein [Dyadobacter sp. BE31]MDR7263632.1 hypothetical protein [Dyadobacter sp. BE32]
MIRFFLASVLLACSSMVYAQYSPVSSHNQKGKVFAYWGWNRASYTQSNIHFKGQEYDFTLKSVVAKDRPTHFTARYFNPSKMTIPQYNFRIGYFISPEFSLSFGFDHMKYVMKQDQTVNITGHISGSGTEYDRAYQNEPIKLTGDFLKFEHTNGLNYLNIELRRMHNLLDERKLRIKNIELNIFEGAGVGILYPKTDVTLLNFDENDQWHIAGYGMNLVGGLNVTFFKHFFIQAEMKGGYINMPDILTTNFPQDHASQHFFFFQGNTNLGVIFKL